MRNRVPLLDDADVRIPINDSKKRVPKSGLVLFGCPLMLGAEDMAFPAILATLFGLCMFGAAIQGVAWAYDVVWPDECTSTQQTTIKTLGVIYTIVRGWLTVADVAVVICAFYSSWFTTNPAMRGFAYIRVLLTVLLAIASLVTAIWWYGNDLKHDCIDVVVASDVDYNELKHFEHLALALVILGILEITFVICLFALLGTCGIMANPCVSAIKCALKCTFCCLCMDNGQSGDEDGSSKDIMSAIAAHFQHFLQHSPEYEDAHIVPSDIAAGLMLVHAAQELRREEYHYDHRSAMPWGCEKEALKAAEQRMAALRDASSSGTHDHRHDCSSSSSPAAANIAPSSTSDVDIDNLNSGSDHDMKTIDDIDIKMVQMAVAGFQPELHIEDWKRIAKAKYYAKYAVGAYGWMLYTLVHPCCCLTCDVCRGESVAVSIPGSGCCGADMCCLWSHSIFTQTTGTRPQDVRRAYGHSNIRTPPVYYLCIDQWRNSIVLAIRGTMSIADTISDMDADEVSLSHQGLKGHHTHSGILTKTELLLADISEEVESLFKEFPDFPLVVVGHSLGAGIAALTTILLCNKYKDRDITCVAYAPPPLFDLELATGAETRHKITSIVYNNDFICQMSVRNLFHLKNEIMTAFQICPPTKWQVWRAQFNRDYVAMFQRGADIHQILDENASTNSDPFNADRMSPGESISSMRSSRSNTDDSIDIKEHKSSNSNNRRGPPTLAELKSGGYVSPHREYAYYKTFLPGRIYHMLLPPQENEATNCFDRCGNYFNPNCCQPRPPSEEWSIYPCSYTTFKEIIVHRSMFLDHMPFNYSMDQIQIPGNVQW